MTVSLIISSLRGGGAERVCIMLANAMHQRGISVNVVVTNLKNAVLRDLLSPDIPIVNLEAASARTVLPALLRYLRRESPDVALCFNHQTASLVLLLRSLGLWRGRVVVRLISSIVTKHSIEVSWYRRKFVWWVVKHLLPRADSIIAQCQGAADEFMDATRSMRHSVIVVPNPVSIPAVTAVRGPVAGKPRILAFAGRLDTVKDVPLLLDAMVNLERMRDDWRLEIFGQGPLRVELETVANRRLPAGRVCFHGFVQDFWAQLDRCDLMLLTSVYEGFPNALLEAIARGVPVVAVDCPNGPREIVIPGENGLLVQSRDPAVFAAAVSKALDGDWDPQVIQGTARRYAPEAIIDRYMEALRIGA